MSDVLNRVITDVARGLTTGAPRADFRARVLDRIAADEPRDRRRPAPWWLNPAVGAAAIAVAVGVALQVRDPRPPAVERGAVVPSALAAGAAAAVTDAGTAAPRAAAADRRPAAPAPAPTPAPALVAWRARAIAALEAIEPLAVPDFQPDGLSIRQLSVAPLDVAPIVIEPIGEGGR
jgi:hypothetical protein